MSCNKQRNTGQLEMCIQSSPVEATVHFGWILTFSSEGPTSPIFFCEEGISPGLFHRKKV